MEISDGEIEIEISSQHKYSDSLLVRILIKYKSQNVKGIHLITLLLYNDVW